MNSSTIMIIAALCLAIGYVAGLLVSSLFGNRSKPEDESARSERNQELPSNAETPTAKAAQQALHFDQILFWRDRSGDPLQIELDGEALHNTGSLTADQRQRLAALFPEIRAWIDQPAPKTREESAREFSGAFNTAPEPKKGFIRLDLNPKPPVPQAPKSIVTQIDDILQTQISGSALAGRGIRLVDAPGQGVIVWVGLEHYQGINAVTDAEVLAAIRRAVTTWEASA